MILPTIYGKKFRKDEADFNNSIEDISNLLNDFRLDEQNKMDTLIIDKATLYDDIKNS